MACSNASSLLRLPRELRDRIYTYALHESDGLIFHREDDYKAYFCTDWRQPREANQLQYTCWQLRSETLKVEWQLNDLVFLNHPERRGKFTTKTPPVQLLGFLDMCSESWRQRIRCIVLLAQDHFGDYGSLSNLRHHVHDLNLVALTCENYTHMTVRWHLDLGQNSLSDLIMYGLVVVRGLRGNAVAVENILKELGMKPESVRMGTFLQSWCGEWRRCCGFNAYENVLPARRFRIVPFGEIMDAEDIRMKMGWCEAEDEPTHWDAPGVVGAHFFEKRLALAMEWARDGF
ncbi:hypothetical protein J4E85_002280 [Alternaria conjuncta]|uniref:uncharacterized protein n=1 Tax=Alternaria conjuncta TaxID=181017 RepID=UPI00221E66DD|nr:uncharacterized protein J4E85_002280 [Alternaria conjuncta]KAI4934423.1 hypothetical protein J4E85_002280 [Alternaria conjuncta]